MNNLLSYPRLDYMLRMDQRITMDSVARLHSAPILSQVVTVLYYALRKGIDATTTLDHVKCSSMAVSIVIVGANATT
jgi:hypothetical protein